MWSVCWWISLAILALAGLLACHLASKKLKKVRPLYIMFGGVFLSAVILLYPIWYNTLLEESNSSFKAIVVGMHSAIQFFTADSGYELVRDNIGGLSEGLKEAYAILGAILLLLAPVLTFGFVLTFFRGLSARLRMAFHLPKDIYVFSEINPRSVSLAEGARKDNARAMVVFTNTPKDEEKLDDDLVCRVKKLGALLYWDDISLIWIRRPFRGEKTYFFAICEKEAESISETLQLVEKYRERENATLYLFSHGVDSEMMLNNLDKGKLTVHRINPTTCMVNHILATEGTQLFDSAVPMDDTTKQISALVVGLGGLGTEMLKALSWYCQMDGYRLHINAFSPAKASADRLRALCPELIDSRYNGRYVPGEAFYDIHVHTCDIRSATFRDIIREIGTVTYAFVSLGDDSLNVTTAVNLRILFEQMHIHPRIVAVVSDSERRAALMGVGQLALKEDDRRKGPSYDIHYVGDVGTVYSPPVIMHPKLEQEALALHMRYSGGDPYGFYEFEYNYKSSMASVIHDTARKHCHIPGAGKATEDLTPEEQRIIEMLEHKRWNAYMRSEGFIYSGSKDPSSRNNLGKMHHNLVVFDELSDEDKRKDSRVATKASEDDA